MKKYTLLLPLVLAFVAILALNQCKKHPKDPITIEYKLGEIKDYMFFKRGTYWVYEHSITGQIDSQYVTSAAISRYTSKGREDYSKHKPPAEGRINLSHQANGLYILRFHVNQRVQRCKVLLLR